MGVSMSYFKRVVKRRPASMTEDEWLQVVERGKLPRPDFRSIDDREYPPPDVTDLVMFAELDRLRWRLESLRLALQEPTVTRKGDRSSTSNVRIGELLSQFSTVWEFLTATSYGSGRKRQTGRLSLSLASDGLKVTLTDDTMGVYCTRVGETLEDALLTLELALKDGSLVWAPSSFAKAKK